MSPQDKIMTVANKLGLTTLKDMQASTGAIYDVDRENAGVLFKNSSRHTFVTETNITQNQFEVNEALLIESIGFFLAFTNNPIFGNLQHGAINWSANGLPSNVNITYDVIIGNKRVVKDAPMFVVGGPSTFASAGLQLDLVAANNGLEYVPRHQSYMEGVGILIPPQVQFSIEYNAWDIYTGAAYALPTDLKIGAYLFGTRVLLNFNTTI